MRISYVGARDSAWTRKNVHRLAVIDCDPDNEKETRRLDRVVSVLGVKGWNVAVVVEGVAHCEVFDRDEFNDFAADFKEVKKSVALWEKYGI